MNVPADGAAAAAVLFLRSGQYWFGGRADGVARVATVLGSCVAVTLWHAHLRCGGMCHFVLPRREPAGGGLDARYGDEAFELLARAAARHGTHLGEYEVGLFGGAHMFPQEPNATIDIGAHNTAEARGLLARHRIVAQHEALLGYQSRHLSLDLTGGRITLRTGSAAGRILEPLS